MKRYLISALTMALVLTSCDSHELEDGMGGHRPGAHQESVKVLLKMDSIFTHVKAQYPSARLDSLMREAAEITYYRGKSIGYLGASLVNLPECAMARHLVEKALGCVVTHYGHGGYGYAAKHNLRHYAASMGKHDVYVLWGTTNDYSLDVPVGDPTDYTEADGFDKAKLKTACGGMNFALQQARRINPDALILGYTNPKMFNGDKLDGSSRKSGHTNKAGFHFYDYVDAQLACFKRAGIPCLNVWDWDFFNYENWDLYYMKDGTHMQYAGYYFLAIQHLEFLMKQVKKNDITGSEDVIM